MGPEESQTAPRGKIKVPGEAGLSSSEALEQEDWPRTKKRPRIREARKAYQADGVMPDWASFEELIG